MEEEKKEDVKLAVVRESQIFNHQSTDRKNIGGVLMKNNARNDPNEENKQA